jgi:hypothetical protein
MSEAELKEVYAFALDLGRRAGKILLDGVEKRTGEQSGRDVGVTEEKMNAVDIVCVPSPIQFKNANYFLRSLKQISVPHISKPPVPLQID